jgi:hypothetical protein
VSGLWKKSEAFEKSWEQLKLDQEWATDIKMAALGFRQMRENESESQWRLRMPIGVLSLYDAAMERSEWLKRERKMAVGNIHSNEPGSGARYNDGKDPLDLVPARCWADVFRYNSDLLKAAQYLTAVEEWHRDKDDGIPVYLHEAQDLEIAAKVFDYGRKKYAAWNWAKGMQWSVPIGCALRHMLAIHRGEMDDPESKLPHWGHVMCNLIMLDHFIRYYPEGDDMRIPLCQTT